MIIGATIFILIALIRANITIDNQYLIDIKDRQSYRTIQNIKINLINKGKME
jgi:hypothetical protein